MKYEKIILFFCIALPLSVSMRILQLYYTVELKTGFYKPEYQNAGLYLLLVILAFCAVTAVLSFTSHRNPEHPPRITPPLTAAALFFAAAVCYELFHEVSSASVKPWQMTLLTLTGFGAVLFFIYYAVSPYINFRLPKLCAAFPAVYFILRIICSFTAISSLALISDNILVTAAYCLILLFMLAFAKLYNGLDSEYNFRKLLAFGLVSVILCATQAIPHIMINISTDGGYSHTTNAANISLLAAGVFIAVFIFSHFSAKNADAPAEE